MKNSSKYYISYPEELFDLDEDLQSLIHFIHFHFEGDIKKKLRFINQKIEAKLKKCPNASLDLSEKENEKRSRINDDLETLRLRKRMLLKNPEFRWIRAVYKKKYWQLNTIAKSYEENTGLAADDASIWREQFKKELANKIQDLIILYANQHMNRFSDIEDLVYKMNLFLKAGNDFGLWRICLIGSIVIADRDPNPLAKKGALDHAINLEKLHKGLHKQLTKIITEPGLLNEALYLSLMLDSYVVKKQVFMAVIGALQLDQNLQYVDGFVVVNVVTSANNPSRKVFLSPITRFIWERLKVHGKIILPDEKMQFSRPFFQLLNLHGQYTHQYKYPKSLRDWFNPVSAYLQICSHLPSLILRYQKKDISYSLKEMPFGRVFGLEYVFSPNDVNEKSAFKNKNHKVDRHRPVHSMWSKATSLLDKKKVSENEALRISEHLRGLLDAPMLDCNEVYLLEWALHLMNPIDKKVGNSPRKALDKVQNLVARVVGLANSVPLTKLKAKDRQNIFELVLEFSTSEKNYRFTSDNLFHFNAFLEEVHNVESIADETIIRPRNSDSFYTINADLITFDEFEKLKSFLLEIFDKTQERKYQVMVIMLIMGFRLGMRKEEVIGLKFTDFVGENLESVIYLKESENRGLKTINSRREFFLKHDMPNDEIKMLCAFQEASGKQFHNPTYFFASSGRKKLSDRVTVIPLIDILRSQTGNPHIGFHQLRHSKASWTMLMAFEGQYQLNIGQRFFSHLPKTKEWLEGSKKRLQNILPNAEDFSKAAYWLHKKMGHSSLSMTLGHYVHFMDIVVAAFSVKASKGTLEYLIAHVKSSSGANANNWLQYNYKDSFQYLNQVEDSKKNKYPPQGGNCIDKSLSEDCESESQAFETVNEPSYQEILEQNKKLSNAEVQFELSNLLPYQIHQTWLKQNSDEGSALTLAYGLNESAVDKVNQLLISHPKLGFKKLPEKYNLYLLSYLQVFLSMKKEQNHLFEIFENNLNVGYQKAKKGELKLVNNYSLKFTNIENTKLFIEATRLSGLVNRYTLIYSSKTDSLESAKQYWKSIIQDNEVGLADDKSKNKQGKLEIKFLLKASDKQKFQAFYLAIALMQLFLLMKEVKSSN